MVSEDAWAGLVDKFADGAYASVKGMVRTYVLHQQLLEHLPPPPAAVLDVGGGAGHQSFPLAHAGYEVTLLDSSPAMLDKARERLRQLSPEAQQRVTLMQADGENAVGAVDERRFAAVLCHGVLGYLEHPEPLVAELCSCAAEGGLVSIMTGNAETMAVRPALERRWDDALRRLRRQNRDRVAGRARSGRHGAGAQRTPAGPRRGAAAVVRRLALRRLARVQRGRIGPRRHRAGGGHGGGGARGKPAGPVPPTQSGLSPRGTQRLLDPGGYELTSSGADRSSRRFCRRTRSSHRPNFEPTCGILATSTKPRRSWKRMEASFSPVTAPTMTCLPSSLAASHSECIRVRPTPVPQSSSRTWIVCSTVNR